MKLTHFNSYFQSAVSLSIDATAFHLPYTVLCFICVVVVIITFFCCCPVSVGKLPVDGPLLLIITLCRIKQHKAM